MAQVQCEKLDIDGNPTGIIVSFEEEMAKKIMSSKAFGSFRLVKKPQPQGRNVKK